MENKLIFNRREYELVEVPDSRFRVFGQGYEDVGWRVYQTIEKDIPFYECFSVRIKDKFYGLKLIEI